MKHNTIKIKWKIFAYLLAFTGILLVLLWLLQICYLDVFYKKIKTSEAEKLLSQVTTVLQQGADSETIGEKIDELGLNSGMAILITDLNGTIQFNAEYIATTRMNTMPIWMILDCYGMAKENGGIAKVEYEGGMNKTFMHGMPPNVSTDKEELPTEFIQNRGQEQMSSVIYVKLLEKDDTEWIVMVNAQLTPVDATVQTLRVELTWITIVMVILSLIIALLLSRQISKPFTQINNSAKELAKGNFDVVFEGKSYLEIAELADTLNYTAQELNKSENFKRELLANVSHDLRTPLTMITAYSEVMRDLPGENTPENVQVVIEEAQRLTGLVNDMLDISKLQAGVMELHGTEYNLTQSILSVLNRYNKLKEQDGYSIDFIYEDEAMVYADEEKIYQVLYNLINNAINYTGEAKRVVVRQVLSDGYVRIEVEDFGEGIEKDALPYVWDRYYKVDKTHKRAVTGTGLGLSIVKNVLELHKAEYGVTSEVGKGSTFWFTLKSV